MTSANTHDLLQSAIKQHSAGDLDRAEKFYDQILSHDASHATAIHLLGVIAGQRGLDDKAFDLMQESLTLEPDNPNFLYNFAAHSLKTRHWQEAKAAFESCIRSNPISPDFHRGLGVVLVSLNDFDNAIASFQTALRLSPNHPQAIYGLGLALQRQGQASESIALFEKASHLQPDWPDPHIALTQSLLLNGDFDRGFTEYEWRWKGPLAPYRRDFPMPLWDGSELKDKRILIHSEQGFGDEIQFVRYVPLLAERGAKVILECTRDLAHLFQSVHGIHQIIPRGDSLPIADFHSPMLHLPKIFKTRLDSIPASIPYLQADPARIQSWRSRTNASSIRIGLAWAGNPNHTNDHNRSIPFAMLEPLTRIPRTTFYSLQKGSSGNNTGSIENLAADLTDFSDTAAAIANLDLVICVDTAVAHLAGAMGKPVWLLLPFSPDWRWLLHRDDTPWYPTMRLLRQRFASNWSETIDRVAQELSAYTPARASA